MGKKRRACKTCGKNIEGKGHLCNPSEITEAFAVELANQCYRIKRNLSALEGTGINNKETRMLNRTIENIQRAMLGQKIELIDYTDKPLVDGQKDFEVVGDPAQRLFHR